MKAQDKFVKEDAVIRIVQVFNLVTRCIRPQRRQSLFLIKNREKLFGGLKT
jgi:hypothetical protein